MHCKRQESRNRICATQLTPLKICYATALANAPMAINLDPSLADSYLAEECIAEELAVEACELVLDTGEIIETLQQVRSSQG